jgi:hypothetical protein
MKSCFLVVIAVIACSCPIFAVDYAAWVRTTDRSSNPDIIRLMAEGDLAQALDIASALGRRADPYVADIIARYLSLYEGGRQYQYERVLLTLLDSVFYRGLSEEERKRRADANKDIIPNVINECEEFTLPELRASCIRLASLSDAAGSGPLLEREGERIVARLKRNRGLLDRAETEEFLVICDAIEKLKSKEFRSLLVDCARLSDDRTVVERARALAAALD